jgi:major type 1 subunit fimbrin (pilin)
MSQSVGLKIARVKRRGRLLVTAMLFSSLLCLSDRAWALKCEDNASGATDITTAVPPKTIAYDAPAGTIVWQSSPVYMKMKCYKNSSNVKTENVYAYINPAKSTFDQGLSFGIVLNGVDYPLKNGNWNKLDLKVSLPPCRTSKDCSNTVKTFDMSYQIYVKKTAATSPSGSYQGQDLVRFVQLDGYYGLNIDGNFGYSLTGLKQVRFLSCGATATFRPGAVDLGRVIRANAQVGQRADSSAHAFDLVIDKNCADDFGVNVYYDSPENLADSGTALALSNGLNLKLKKSNGSYVTFKTMDENFIVRGAGKTSKTETFQTELYWRTTQPTLGKFSTSATVTLYYN